ncbi:sigma-70 family RNA polymerase sigma factor [Virgibacillus oceani]|uniref:RNA polymerase sigma-70 region 2 domain-containing protein n=1 Tax=Virgibacillus oceani TaxID=1479511 RepID=A0A917H9P0_9BACI|nr:sigma-70 family RNA polymerase sigma factor [Virgibacillus oceani]GGG72168.1 hypothetical protein GCM10011398_15650 [Virgibacillus oceani]
MRNEKNDLFGEIFLQNKRRIYYQIHKLNLDDPHEEYYQEGLCAMWNAYENYQPDKGMMSTYFNYVIRNRLIDLNRKKKRDKQAESIVVREKMQLLHEGNKRHNGPNAYPVVPVLYNIMDNPELLQRIRALLTENQWKWVHFHIILDMAIKDIAAQENTTVDAVKGWGRQVRKKLNNQQVRDKLELK